MKTLYLLIRAVGIIGAGAITLWLIGRHAAIMHDVPPDRAPAVFDQLLYFTTIPIGTLAFLLILPYRFLPPLARRICRLLLLLLGAYYLLYRFGPYFFPSPHPYARPETLTIEAGAALIFWIIFLLAQLYAIYHTDDRMPAPDTARTTTPQKAPS